MTISVAPGGHAASAFAVFCAATATACSDWRKTTRAVSSRRSCTSVLELTSRRIARMDEDTVAVEINLWVHGTPQIEKRYSASVEALPSERFEAALFVALADVLAQLRLTTPEEQ